MCGEPEVLQILVFSFFPPYFAFLIFLILFVSWLFFSHSSKIFNILRPPFHFWAVFDAKEYASAISWSCNGPRFQLRVLSLLPNTLTSFRCWSFRLKTLELQSLVLFMCTCQDPVSTLGSLLGAPSKWCFHFDFEFSGPWITSPLLWQHRHPFLQPHFLQKQDHTVSPSV